MRSYPDFIPGIDQHRVVKVFLNNFPFADEVAL
jgi:hypothetical protein